jgi:hypothetical protein
VKNVTHKLWIYLNLFPSSHIRTLNSFSHLRMGSTKKATTKQAAIMQARYIPVIRWIFDVSGGCRLGLAASAAVLGQKLAPHISFGISSCNAEETVSDSSDVRFETVVLVESAVGSGAPPVERTATKGRLRIRNRARIH